MALFKYNFQRPFHGPFPFLIFNYSTDIIWRRIVLVGFGDGWWVRQKVCVMFQHCLFYIKSNRFHFVPLQLTFQKKYYQNRTNLQIICILNFVLMQLPHFLKHFLCVRKCYNVFSPGNLSNNFKTNLSNNNNALL